MRFRAKLSTCCACGIHGKNDNATGWICSDLRLAHLPLWIQCGRFIGNDKAEIFDHIELYNHLPETVDSIMLFLKKHAMRSADLSGIRRKDVWSILLTILREVVINALVHADYSQRGGPTTIAFFDDRIEVENPGILLPGMTIQDMKDGVSKIRNPVIASVFRELGLIEQWGSRIKRIFKEVDELGLPELQIVELDMRLRVIVSLLTPIVLRQEKSEQLSGVESGVESNMTRQIIAMLEEKTLAKSEIADWLGKEKPTHYLDELMRKLLYENLVEYTIPQKPNSRLQKYRLTPKGKTMVGMDESHKQSNQKTDSNQRKDNLNDK